MKPCIVCNDPSRNHRSSLCEKCFKELLDKKLDEDDSIKPDRPGFGWF